MTPYDEPQLTAYLLVDPDGDQTMTLTVPGVLYLADEGETFVLRAGIPRIVGVYPDGVQPSQADIEAAQARWKARRGARLEVAA